MRICDKLGHATLPILESDKQFEKFNTMFDFDWLWKSYWLNALMPFLYLGYQNLPARTYLNLYTNNEFNASEDRIHINTHVSKILLGDKG